ncbi:hypothetical protein EB118_12660 [bacterium]|nr:hypothetical protein [bacterium]NDG30911.1 hypothetical protein [bacterium]
MGDLEVQLNLSVLAPIAAVKALADAAACPSTLKLWLINSMMTVWRVARKRCILRSYKRNLQLN